MPARSTRHYETLLTAGDVLLGTIAFTGVLEEWTTAPTYTSTPTGTVAFSGSIVSSFTVDVTNPPNARGKGSKKPLTPVGVIAFAGSATSTLVGARLYSSSPAGIVPFEGTVVVTYEPPPIEPEANGVSISLVEGSPFAVPTWTALDQ